MKIDDKWLSGGIILLVAVPIIVAILRSPKDAQPAEKEKPPKSFLRRVLGFFYVEPQLIAAVIGFFVLAAVVQYLSGAGEAFIGASDANGKPSGASDARGNIVMAMVFAAVLIPVAFRVVYKRRKKGSGEVSSQSDGSDSDK